MRQVNLGSQGLVVSAQGLGCMGMSTTYGPSDEQENLGTLARALELGVTLFDTAEVYGPYMNEELLGKAFAGKRDTIVLATKVGFKFTAEGKLAMEAGTPLVSGAPTDVRTAVDGSPAATQDRLHRSSLSASHRPSDTDRGYDRHAGCAREGRQGPLYRRLGGIRGDDPQGARRPSRHGRPDRIFAVRARG